LKIIYYSPHPNLNLSDPAGYGTHMREMINAFRELGHEVITCIMGGEEKQRDDMSIQFNESLPKKAIKSLTPTRIWQSLKDIDLIRFDKTAAKKLELLVKKEKPDLIYERGFYMMISGVETAKKYEVKHILEINAPYTEEKTELEGKSLLFKKAAQREQQQVENTSQVVVVSSALKKYFSEKYPSAEQKILITPNAVDPAKTKADAVKTQELTVRYSISEDELVIGFVGSIFPHHGVDDLIHAFHQLVEKGLYELKLLIVGDGETLDQLKQLAHELDTDNKVIFIGNVPSNEVYNYIELMDICIMAKSNWYGSPVKIFEYGSMGKAIIAPDVDPVRDVMQNEVHGILIRSSVSELTAALKKLLSDKALKEKIARNFQQKVLSEHTWLKMAEKILSPV